MQYISLNKQSFVNITIGILVVYGLCVYDIFDKYFF